MMLLSYSNNTEWRGDNCSSALSQLFQNDCLVKRTVFYLTPVSKEMHE